MPKTSMPQFVTRIRRALWPGDENFSRRVIAYRWLAIVFTLICIIANCAIQIRRRDGDPYLFLGAAREFIQGHDIYAWVSPHGNSYYYPPFFALLMLPLTLIGGNVVIVLWAIASVALLAWSMAKFLAGIAKVRFFSMPQRTRWAVCLLSTIACLRFILLHLRFGQTNIFVLALTILGLTWFSRNRSLRAGIALALAIVVKLITAPFGFWFLAKRKSKILFGMALGLALGVTLPALVVGFRKNVEYHREWLSTVALSNAPGTGNWAGVGNVSLRAQADRFFLNTPAFIYRDSLYRVTIIELPHGVVRLMGYAVMLIILSAILFYAIRFRNAAELISRWGGFAFVFSLIPNFSPVAEIPHLVVLIPAYIYVFYIWYSRLIADRVFSWLVIFSFVFASLATRGFLGVFLGRLLTAWGIISLGVLLLSAAILRAAFVMNRNQPHQHRSDKFVARAS